MGDCRSTFAALASALEPVNLVDIIPVVIPGQIIITTSPAFLTGPTSLLGEWVGTGGAGGSPTLITEGPSIVLQSAAWTGFDMPTQITYTRSGSQKWRNPAGRILGDFTATVPFP